MKGHSEITSYICTKGQLCIQYPATYCMKDGKIYFLDCSSKNMDTKLILNYKWLDNIQVSFYLIPKFRSESIIMRVWRKKISLGLELLGIVDIGGRWPLIS